MTQISILLLDRDLARELGAQLCQLRHERHLYLKNVATQTKLPERVIEGMELGRFLRYNAFRRLLKFYGKRAKITLE